MLCYVRLHGELALRAKGVLLLARRAGWTNCRSTPRCATALPSLPQPREKRLAKHGVLALRPLIMANRQGHLAAAAARPLVI